MKKFTLAALASAALLVASCGHKTPKANLETDADSLAYYAGLAQAEGFKMALAQYGVDSTEMDAFYKGFFEAAKIDPTNKSKAAYLTGIQLGQIVSQRMLPGLGQEVFGNDSTKQISLQDFMAGLLNGVEGKDTTSSMYAQDKFNSLMKSIKEKNNAPLIKAGKEYIEKFSKQSGVKKLDGCDVYYKVIKEGDGEKPNYASNVKVHYEGKTIDGKIFDSSIKRGEPQVMNVGQVIKGWQEALIAMPVGSKWEIVIPYNLAYGEHGAGEDIKPFSTLIFTVELISIEGDGGAPQRPQVQVVPQK